MHQLRLMYQAALRGAVATHNVINCCYISGLDCKFGVVALSVATTLQMKRLMKQL
jgi:hypothetical protein